MKTVKVNFEINLQKVFIASVVIGILTVVAINIYVNGFQPS